MTILPILAGIVAAFGWGLSDYIAGGISRKIGQYKSAVYVLLFSAIVLVFVFIFTGISTQASLFILFLAVLSAIPAFLGYFFAYKAFAKGDFSITAPIIGCYPAVIVIGSVFLLGDKLSALEIVAIATILLGIILLSTKFSDLKSKKKLIAAGVGSAILAMIFLGTPGIFSGAYTAIIGFVLLSLIWRAFGAMFGFGLGRLLKQDVSFPKMKYVGLIAVAGILDAIGVIAFLYGVAVDSATLPIIASLAGLTGAVTVGCALILLKEKPEFNQWIGILLAIAGVVLIAYIS